MEKDGERYKRDISRCRKQMYTDFVEQLWVFETNFKSSPFLDFSVSEKY